MAVAYMFPIILVIISAHTQKNKLSPVLAHYTLFLYTIYIRVCNFSTFLCFFVYIRQHKHPCYLSMGHVLNKYFCAKKAHECVLQLKQHTTSTLFFLCSKVKRWLYYLEPSLAIKTSKGIIHSVVYVWITDILLIVVGIL